MVIWRQIFSLKSSYNISWVRIFHKLGSCKQINSPRSEKTNSSRGWDHILGGRDWHHKGGGRMPSIVRCPPLSPPSETLHRVTPNLFLVRNPSGFLIPTSNNGPLPPHTNLGGGIFWGSSCGIYLHSANEWRIETRRAGYPTPTNRPIFLILKDSAMTRAGDNVPVKKTSLGKTKTKPNEVMAKKDREV